MFLNFRKQAEDLLPPVERFVEPVFFVCLFVFCLFREAPTAYGSSQARGPIGAVAAGLHHSHSNTGSELHLRPIPQLMATQDPLPMKQGQGANLYPQGY